MTTTDPTVHAEGQLDSGQHAAADLADTPTDAAFDPELDWLHVAANQYRTQKNAGFAPTTDTLIATELASTAETRELRYDVRDLKAAIERLETVLGDHTATMKAFLAQKRGGLFGLEEAEDAVEKAAGQKPAAGG